MANNTDAWLKRGKEILAKGMDDNSAVPFAASILASLYGPKSAELDAFNNGMKEISVRKGGAVF